MSKQIDALNLAEEALEELHYSSGTVKAVTLYKRAIAVIHEALADHIADAGKVIMLTAGAAQQIDESLLRVEQSAEECEGDDGMVMVVPLDLYNELAESLETIRAARAQDQAEQEPFVWACTECGTELEDDDTRKYCNSCGYNKFYKSPRILRQEPVSQEPVAYLCDGARYKIMGEDRSGFGRILGLPESLAGQWVALVDATDGKHLRAEPARTKDLTDFEIDCIRFNLESGKTWIDFARAVIAADRKLNGVEK